MRAMILAAGKGTRLKPLTNNRPKALVEIKGIPLLEIVIKRLIRFGFKDLIINVHHFADQIIHFLIENDNFGIKIQISDETEKLFDTGGGIIHAKSFLNDGNPFLVYNVDILSDINLDELMEFHYHHDQIATLAVKDRVTKRYLLFDEENILCEWQNIQTGVRKVSREPKGNLKLLAYSGVQVINPEIFDLIEERGVFSIMDVYLRLAKYHNIRAFDHSHTIWFDMGRYKQVIDFEEKMDLAFLR
jgi:NDP-sugar pyrophosphorylase family protein